MATKEALTMQQLASFSQHSQKLENCKIINHQLIKLKAANNNIPLRR